MVVSSPPELIHAVLSHFLRDFLLCLFGTLIFGAWLFVVTHLWLRYTAAEAAFWNRLGFPSRRFTDASRRLEEGRAFTYALCFLLLSFCLLMAFNGAMYFYWKGRFHSTRQPNYAIQLTTPRSDASSTVVQHFRCPLHSLPQLVADLVLGYPDPSCFRTGNWSRATRNVEFDPKRNLFTNLKDDERVTMP